MTESAFHRQTTDHEGQPHETRETYGPARSRTGTANRKTESTSSRGACPTRRLHRADTHHLNFLKRSSQRGSGKGKGSFDDRLDGDGIFRHGDGRSDRSARIIVLRSRRGAKRSGSAATDAVLNDSSAAKCRPLFELAMYARCTPKFRRTTCSIRSHVSLGTSGKSDLSVISGRLVFASIINVALIRATAIAMARIAGTALDMGNAFCFWLNFRVDRGRKLTEQSQHCLAIGPTHIDVLSLRHSANPSLRLVDPVGDLRLRQAVCLNLGEDCFPVHAAIITTVFV